MLKTSLGVGRKSSCFIADDEIISGDNAVIEMWANHFEKLGMPGSHPTFNDKDTIEREIKMILAECMETPTTMKGLFVYVTVKEVCTNWKPGVSGGFDQEPMNTSNMEAQSCGAFVNTLLSYVLFD